MNQKRARSSINHFTPMHKIDGGFGFESVASITHLPPGVIVNFVGWRLMKSSVIVNLNIAIIANVVLPSLFHHLPSLPNSLSAYILIFIWVSLREKIEYCKLILSFWVGALR